MAGRTKALIEKLVALRGGGRSGTEHFVRAHLVLMGINPDEHGDTTSDDPDTVQRLQQMIERFRQAK